MPEEQRNNRVSDLERKEKTLPDTAGKRRHLITEKRLSLAGWTLAGCGVLMAGALGLSVWSPWRAEVNIYATFIYSLFGIVTLALGFIAGSGIDRD